MNYESEQVQQKNTHDNDLHEKNSTSSKLHGMLWDPPILKSSGLAFGSHIMCQDGHYRHTNLATRDGLHSWGVISYATCVVCGCSEGTQPPLLRLSFSLSSLASSAGHDRTTAILASEWVWACQFGRGKPLKKSPDFLYLLPFIIYLGWKEWENFPT